VNNVFSECDGFAFQVPGARKQAREDLCNGVKHLKLLLRRHFAGHACRSLCFFQDSHPARGLRAAQPLIAHQKIRSFAMIDQIIPRD